jgi:hypothetical protein
MAPSEPQSETLSLRISESLRRRLERIRELVSRTKGETVSTSEIAKRLLESAREDRLEVAELLMNSTKALVEIRRKGEEGRLLSRAEWTAVAYFVQQGAEGFDRNPISLESSVTILEAFHDVYEKLGKAPSNQEPYYYLGNLPSECRPEGAEADSQATPETVRRTVEETIRRLSDPTTVKWRPTLAARNLYVLLDHERPVEVDALNGALRPYWPVLWRVAARGNYFVNREPIREKPEAHENLYQPAIAPVREGEYSLSFARGEGYDFDILLSFPGPRGPMYPIGPYPKIAEFWTMLSELKPETVDMRGRQLTRGHWSGEEFYGYMVEREGEREYWFRARQNGITFGFSEAEWRQVQRLFKRAWENPEVKLAWEGLLREYGEM